MMNPNEIASKRFDKSMSGYKIDDVETFLDKVAQDFAQLLNERYDLEQKISVLADKLEEYKRDEESLKSAVFEAQKLGSSLVREAQNKAERIVQEATEKGNFITTDASQRADQMLAEINAQCQQTLHEQEANISARQTYYDRLCEEIAAFNARLKNAYREHLGLLQNLSDDVEAEIAARANDPAPEPMYIPEPAAQPQPEQTDPEPEETTSADAAAQEPAEESAEDAVAEPVAEPEAEPGYQQEPEPEYDAESDPLPEIPVDHGTPESVTMTGPEEKPTAGYSVIDEPTKEMPSIHAGKHGVLKFGDNYNMREDREARGRRKK